jgi:Asp-tRNA(Asn)/Glu-tRNA(Gln) amidotransferase A subunit family amidase
VIRSKELSPLELMEETLKRIDEVNPELNAFVTLRADEALVEAKSLAGRISSGEDPGPLAGIPIGIKGPGRCKADSHPIPLLWAVAFTYPFNLSGHPAATVRAGLTKTDLPGGLQIIGPRHRDDLVLQTAYAYENSCPWNDNWPDI